MTFLLSPNEVDGISDLGGDMEYDSLYLIEY